MEQTYTVKEAAQLLGVSPHTVRFYDDKGLIPGTTRNKQNNRVFGGDEIEWLFVDIILRETGLSLAEIKHYIELYEKGDKTIAARRDIMLAQKERTLKEMDALKIRLKMLDRKIDHYTALLSGEKDEWSHDYMKTLISERAKNNSEKPLDLE